MKDSTFSLEIPGYTFFHFARSRIHPRAHRASGGIGIFISDRIKGGVHFFSNTEIIAWIKLDSKWFNIQRDLYIGCVYLPP